MIDEAAEIAGTQGAFVDTVGRTGGKDSAGDAKCGKPEADFCAMMPVMRVSLILTVVAILAGAQPAAAQFYDLDGAYHCLTQPDALCQQGERDRPAPLPSPVMSADAVPTLDDVIAHVRTKTVDARDLEFLERRVAAREARAVEVLAWCKLNGIGAPADVAAAYLLYGQAADLGVPNARQNQMAIYETKLTPDQRQSVLLREIAH